MLSWANFGYVGLSPTSSDRLGKHFASHLCILPCIRLWSGPTGTGKTIVVQQQLLKGLDREFSPQVKHAPKCAAGRWSLRWPCSLRKYSTFAFAFSAQSSANQTQEMLHFSLATSTSNDPGLVGTCADLTAASKVPSGKGSEASRRSKVQKQIERNKRRC